MKAEIRRYYYRCCEHDKRLWYQSDLL